MDRSKNPPGRLRANLPVSPSKRSVLDTTSSWVESSSSLSDTTTKKGHKASKSINRAEGDASRADPKANEGSISTGHGKDVSETCPKLPKIGVDVERQNSWAQQVHESEHENSWAQETQQGLGLGFAQARRNVVQAGRQVSTRNAYLGHQKSRSVTDPASSNLTADTRGLGPKLFQDRVSMDLKNGQDNIKSEHRLSPGLSSYNVLGDKASRVLGAQHVVTTEDRTLLQLPGFRSQKPEAIIFSGSMSPTKSGAYGTVGKAHTVANQFARVKSQQGLFATVEDEQEPFERDAAGLELLSSAVYSPSVYGGVWEKHPSVGRTIPPYSPAAAYGAKNYIELLKTPAGPELAEGNSPRLSKFHESAEVLPLFTGQEDSSVRQNKHNSFHVESVGNNPAPAHPASLDAAHSSTEAKLQQMEARLHHHIDHCFDRLARTITDKSDKVLDVVMGKHEALEEQLSKGSNGISQNDIRLIKHEFVALEQALTVNAGHVTEVRRMVQAMHRTVGRLENQIIQYACKCDHGDMEQQNHEEEREAITFFDGHRHFTIDNHGNQTPAPATHQQQNMGARHCPAGSYRQNGQVNSAEIPKMDQNGNPVVGNLTQDGVTYDLPSCMTLDNNGNLVVDIEEDETPGSQNGEVEEGLVYRIDQNGNPVQGSQRPDQVVYDLPSFMRLDNNGHVVINLEENEVPQIDENGNPVLGNEVHDGVTYDMPSFLTMDRDGNVMVNIQDDGMPPQEGQQSEEVDEAGLSRNDENEAIDRAAVADFDDNGNPLWGIQGPGNIVYDLPSFMDVTAQGEIVINLGGADQVGQEANVTHGNGSTLGENEAVADVPQIDEHGNVVRGVREGVVTYDMPSFMRDAGDGAVLIDVDQAGIATAAEGTPPAALGQGIPTIILYIDENGRPVHGIEGPNGEWYELPSFMKVNENGFAEVIEEDDPFVETANGFTNPTGWQQTHDGLHVESSTLIQS